MVDPSSHSCCVLLNPKHCNRAGSFFFFCSHYISIVLETFAGRWNGRPLEWDYLYEMFRPHHQVQDYTPV